MIKFEKISTTSIKVTEDGSFIGWLNRSTHKPTGLNAKRYEIYDGIFSGKSVQANTLTKCRSLIEGAK